MTTKKAVDIALSWESKEEIAASRFLREKLALADKIADALLVFEQNLYIGTPATKELMHLVRDFKGIL